MVPNTVGNRIIKNKILALENETCKYSGFHP